MAINIIGTAADSGSETLLNGTGLFTNLGLPAGGYSITTPAGAEVEGIELSGGRAGFSSSGTVNNASVFGATKGAFAQNGWQQSNYYMYAMRTTETSYPCYLTTSNEDGGTSTQMAAFGFGYVNGSTWHHWWFSTNNKNQISRSYMSAQNYQFTGARPALINNNSWIISRRNLDSDRYWVTTNYYGSGTTYDGNLGYTITCFGASGRSYNDDSYALAACASGRIFRINWNTNNSYTAVVDGSHPDVGTSSFTQVAVSPDGVALAASNNRKLISTSSSSYSSWSGHITNPINDVYSSEINAIYYEEVSGKWFIFGGNKGAYSTDLSTWTEIAMPITGTPRIAGPYLYLTSSDSKTFYASYEGGSFAKYVYPEVSFTQDQRGQEIEIQGYFGHWEQGQYYLKAYSTGWYYDNNGSQEHTTACYHIDVTPSTGILTPISTVKELV